MHSEHIFKQYDAELEAVRAKMLEMGNLVEQQMLDAIEALTKGNVSLANSVIKKDDLVNALEVQIDEDCSHIIARRQPTAGDLRMVLMMVKSITDLERIGDESVKIARFALKSNEIERKLTPRFVEIKAMAITAKDMLHMALDAFARILSACFSRIAAFFSALALSIFLRCSYCSRCNRYFFQPML